MEQGAKGDTNQQFWFSIRLVSFPFCRIEVDHPQLSIYMTKKKKKGSIIREEESNRECAIYLLEFEEND